MWRRSGALLASVLLLTTGAVVAASGCMLVAGLDHAWHTHCDEPQILCDGVCVDPTVDQDNCGACGKVCEMGSACCAGGCTFTTSDRKNCGTCGKACGSADTCCTGLCIDTAIDHDNCGVCGAACVKAGDVCVSSMCCAPGSAVCSGACTDTAMDVDNCGACGQACATGDVCTNGNCCAGGLTYCTNGCTNSATDGTNCGQCGRVCAVGSLCQGGACPLANGSPCTTAGECATNNCIDGICCDQPCTGSCMACSAIGKGQGTDGTCGPVLAGGPDPRGICLPASPTTCGTIGKCDGNGGCPLYPDGTVCVASHCVTDGYESYECASGACTTRKAVSCGAYRCSQASCYTSCTPGAGLCFTNYYCNGTKCDAQGDSGATCSQNNACKSGKCVKSKCM
jgi:Stigma-specific protein, Stig1